MGISGHQSLLRKIPATVSWEECIQHLPLRTFLRSKMTVELCGMDYSLLLQSVVERNGGSVRHEMAPHTLSLVFVGRGNSTGLFLQVLPNDPLSSSVESRWFLVQRSFQGQVGKPRTWER